MPDHHLIVLIHGLQGFNTDMTYLTKQINKEAEAQGISETVHVLAPDCNHALTCDSMEVQGQRIADTITAWLSAHPLSAPVRFSVVGHSLGGLIARTLVTRMDFAKVTPKHFITVAAPHLGSSFMSSVPSALVSYMGGNAGLELELLDQQKLLRRLATEPELLKPLSQFESRTVYSCVAHDLSAGFETAGIRADNPCLAAKPVSTIAVPFSGLLNSLPVLNSSSATQPRLEDISDIPRPDPKPEADPSGDFKAILDGLNSLQWTRIAIYPTRPLLAHVDCIVKDESWNAQFGDSVIQDVVKRLFA
ncbi:putative serine esterase-domain-containing protein [Obelidium mucronatum]|nr:putative serine esterase-domain-containing protein [Obelidium mucronatum]